MNAKFFPLLLSLTLFLTGCGKDENESNASDPQTKQEEDHQAVFVAFNHKDYDRTLQLANNYMNNYPQDPSVPKLKLMMADIWYEQERYPESYMAYREFERMYPAEERAEYAAYKAAHAKFNQANHIDCDATPTEETVMLCQEYKARSDYQQFRRQIVDLERTCQQRLVDKEFYVANTYMTQQRFASAHKRLEHIEEAFDLEKFGGRDKLTFFKAKLAKQENDTEQLVALVDSLGTEFPRSKFTAMAQQLTKPGLLFG